MIGESFDYEIKGDVIYIVYENKGEIFDAKIEVRTSRTEIKLIFSNGRVSNRFHKIYNRRFELIESSGIWGNEHLEYLMSYIAMNHKDELRKM